MPKALRGALFRIGPNPQFQPNEPHHWFGGDGMVHGFYVADGKVGYRNRYHHPQSAVWQRYGRLGIQRLRTDQTGAITLDFAQDSTPTPAPLAVTAYRSEHARYWYGR